MGGQFEPFPYLLLCLALFAYVVVWPGMLFPNSSGIEAAANLHLLYLYAILT